eukprot:scaffold117081_cov22-Prasinocladus_malaysianus.AAC.1
MGAHHSSGRKSSGDGRSYGRPADPLHRRHRPPANKQGVCRPGLHPPCRRGPYGGRPRGPQGASQAGEGPPPVQANL